MKIPLQKSGFVWYNIIDKMCSQRTGFAEVPQKPDSTYKNNNYLKKGYRYE